MPADPLREKLKALVEEWRERSDGNAVLIYPEGERFAYGLCAKQLAALLAESEPAEDAVPHDLTPGDARAPWRAKPEPAPSCPHGGGCRECADEARVEAYKLKRKEWGEPAPLKLGHEFVPCESPTCKGCHRIVGGLRCGHPREAH